jgi:hypothetical protein
MWLVVAMPCASHADAASEVTAPASWVGGRRQRILVDGRPRWIGTHVTQTL